MFIYLNGRELLNHDRHKSAEAVYQNSLDNPSDAQCVEISGKNEDSRKEYEKIENQEGLPKISKLKPSAKIIAYTIMDQSPKSSSNE